MADRRERDHKWYTRFDERTMEIVIETGEGEEITLPAVYEVCTTCGGKGKHVNPSIDSNGLTAEDFDQDPDFRENYFSGMYDQPCVECHGNRVVPTLDEIRATPAQIKLAHEWIEEHYQTQAEYEAERRMGA